MAKILIADDQYENRLLVTTVLQHAGHTVVEAADGAEAVRLAGDGDFDLLLLDLALPGMSGTDVIRALRKREETKGLAIALYTGSSVNSAMRDFMELYAIQHVIPKPSEPQALTRAVEAALRR
jgi:CheY-like chemotaxis protein